MRRVSRGTYHSREPYLSLILNRSKKETQRLHQLHKPARVTIKDDLPSINSDDEEEDGEVWSSDVELTQDEEEGSSEEDESEDDDSSHNLPSQFPARRKKKDKNITSDEEMPYETAPRKRRPSWDSQSDGEKGIERLPIKLANGRIQQSNAKIFLQHDEESSDEESEAEEIPLPERSRVEDVSTGARFGRPAVIDVVGNKSRKARVLAAKEQIAGICQEIVADPENSVRVFSRFVDFILMLQS